MLSVTFSARGREFDVDAFVAEFEICDKEDVFHRGDKRFRRRPPLRESGFRLALFGDDDPKRRDALTEAVRTVTAFLEEEHTAIDRLRALQVTLEISFMFGVGPGCDCVARYLTFPDRFLQILGERGITLETMCCLCSESEPTGGSR